MKPQLLQCKSKTWLCYVGGVGLLLGLCGCQSLTALASSATARQILTKAGTAVAAKILAKAGDKDPNTTAVTTAEPAAD